MVRIDKELMKEIEEFLIMLQDGLRVVKVEKKHLGGKYGYYAPQNYKQIGVIIHNLLMKIERIKEKDESTTNRNQ